MLAGKAHHQDGVGRGHAHAHDGAGEGRNAEPGIGEEQEPHDAGQRGGQRGNDQKRIEPGLEVDDDEQVDKQDGEDQSNQQSRIRLLHGVALSAQNEFRAARQFALVASHDLLHLSGDSAQVGSLDVGEDIDYRHSVVMGHGALFGAGHDTGEIAQNLLGTEGCAGSSRGGRSAGRRHTGRPRDGQTLQVRK